ncbi:MAG: hypothetical protein HZA91_18285 [Verrucomicrobia bacterium]|nr:hypothetical protein [Verrucomicrobiota bacterium]
MNPLLQHLLRSLRRLLRLHLALGGLSRVGAVAVAVATGSWLLDWWLRLGIAQRGLLGTLAIIIMGVAVWRFLLRPVSRRLGDADLALALEQAFPQFGDRLVTVVEGDKAASEISPALLEHVASEAAQIAAGVRPARALDGRRLAQNLAWGGAALALVALLVSLYPRELGIWWQRNVLLRNVDWPRATQLEVLGVRGDAIRLVRGAPLDIVVAASGRAIPDAVRLVMDYEQSGRFRETLAPTGRGRFAKHFDAVVESFQFRAVGGDGETSAIRVELVDPPMLRDVRLKLTYPAYTRQPPRELRASEGAVEAVIGTELELRGVSTKPLQSAAVFFGDKPLAGVTVQSATNVAAKLTVRDSGPVRVALEGADRLRAERALAFALYAQPDRPPTARLALSGIGDKITPVAALPIAAEARDDFGVAALNLAWQTNSGAWVSVPLAGATAGGAESRLETRWPVEQVKAVEGSTLSLRLVATDAATPPGRGASQPLSLRVVSAAELLADLNRRQKEYRAEFERLARKHREALDAMKLLKENPKSEIRNPKEARNPKSEETLSLSRLAVLVADEREAGNGCASMSELFRRILEEQLNNRVGTAAEQQRLRARVIEPLLVVSKQLLGPVVEPLGAVTPSQTAPLETATTAAQAAYDQMRAILAEMLRGETLADAVAALREILKDQDQLNETTRKALEAEIQRLLKGP